MSERWMKTIVYGSGEKVSARETIYHREGADALSMAMRRNHRMPACETFTLVTEVAFTVNCKGPEKHRCKADIPYDDRKEEWCW